MIKHFLKQVRKSIIIWVEKELENAIMPMKSFVKKKWKWLKSWLRTKECMNWKLLILNDFCFINIQVLFKFRCVNHCQMHNKHYHLLRFFFFGVVHNSIFIISGILNNLAYLLFKTEMKRLDVMPSICVLSFCF